MESGRRGDFAGDQLLAGGIGAGQLHDRQAAVRLAQLPAPDDRLHDFALRGRQIGSGSGGIERRQERQQPIVEVVQPLAVADDPLVGAQRAGRQRLPARLRDLDQTPVAQRPLGRQRVPRGAAEQRERQRERRVGTRRIPLGARAQAGDAGVELHADAEQQDLLLELREPQALRQNQERGRRVHLRGGLEGLGRLRDLLIRFREAAARQEQVGTPDRGLRRSAEKAFPHRPRLLFGRVGRHGHGRRRLALLGRELLHAGPQPRQGRGEVARVAVEPVGSVRHVTVTFWVASNTGGVTARLISRLSTPSTRRRTK